MFESNTHIDFKSIAKGIPYRKLAGMILKNAKIMTMDIDGNFDDGFLVIENDRIQKMGAMSVYQENEQGQTVISLKGAWILPGFIDAHSHLGLFDDGLDFEGDDGNESSDPITPQIRAVDGIYNADNCFREAYEGGVSLVMAGPGSGNVMSGQFALLHTYEKTLEKAVIEPMAAQKAAFGENPKRVYGKEDKAPITRMGAASLMRETLFKAQEYEKKWKTYQEKMDRNDEDEDEPDTPEFDFQLESLRPLIKGEIPLKIHAHRQDDILTAIRICNEFGLCYTLDHCTEGHLIADVLSEEYKAGQAKGRGSGNIQAKGGRLLGVIAGPIIGDRSKPELAKATIKTSAILHTAGIPLAIMTDHPCVPEQYLSLSAAIAVKGGLSYEAALSAITLGAAKIIGVDVDYGSLKQGKIADISVFSGDPLDYQSQLQMFIGKGKVIYQSDSLQ